MTRGDPVELVPIDDELAVELRTRLTTAGWSPERDDAFASLIRAATRDAARVGIARVPPLSWTPAWDADLLAWMGVANLDERAAAPGWIDVVVLEELRSSTDP